MFTVIQIHLSLIPDLKLPAGMRMIIEKLLILLQVFRYKYFPVV